MHGVAEWMYNHAEEYGIGNKEEMYLLGYIHDIGYIQGKENHEANGAFLLGKDTYYGRLVRWHGSTPQEYIDYYKQLCPTMGVDIPKELILLWTADMTINSEGRNVGFWERLEDIEDRYGKDSEPYRICSETIEWLRNNVKVYV